MDSQTQAPKYSRQGKGSKQRQADNFNRKKNLEFDQKIEDELAAKYGLTDYPSIKQIPVRATKPAEEVPVTLKNVPPLIEKIWIKMQSLGIRNFDQYNTVQYRLNFVKVFLLICEAKVSYAQRRGSPMLQLSRATSRTTFTDDQILRLARLGSVLPKPLSVFVDHLGYISDSGQTVFPTKAKLQACIDGSGAFNLFPSDLKPLLQAIRAGVPADAAIAGVQHYLDVLGAEIVVENNVAHITEESYIALQYPDGWITDQMEEMFSVVVAAFNIRKNFNSKCSLEHGQGQKTQLVRFPGYELNSVNRYYTTAEIPSYNQVIAGALGYGQEQERLQISRFVSTLTNCLIQGEVDSGAIVHEVIWYEDPE